jgi:hypothetical protein
MTLDEARIYSRKCFLKSFCIIPVYLQTCVDTYALGERARVRGSTRLFAF